MKPKHLLYKFQLLAISFALIGCSLPATSAPTAEPTLTPTVTPASTPTLRPTSTVTPTPFFEVTADRTITVKSGGFRFDLIKGYEVVYNQGSGVFMQSQDNRLNVYLYAYTRPNGQALSTVFKNNLEDIADRLQDFNQTEPVRDSESGIDLISADFTARDGIVPVRGHLSVYEPERSKLLLLYVTAKGDLRWEREGQKALEFTRHSLEFFPITALENCGQSKYPDYGQKPERPILIGGGEFFATSRIESYLDVLLGPDGQVVSYRRLSDTAQKFPGLVLYSVEYQSIYEIYYFDTKHYEPLTAPIGLKCSAPFPERP